MAIDAVAYYKRLKLNPTKYDEEVHAPMLIRVMADPELGTYAAFCKEAFISDDTFYKWINEHDFLLNCYGFGKMLARQNWEEEGRELRLHETLPGTQDRQFEYWRMIGWSRFGVGKNSRIRLNLNPDDNALQHYKQLLKQAGNGEFTAGEIKQLMEGINVGLNTHQVFTMQKEIDDLKSDLKTMQENQNVQNTFTNQGIEKKDSHSLESGICGQSDPA